MAATRADCREAMLLARCADLANNSKTDGLGQDADAGVGKSCRCHWFCSFCPFALSHFFRPVGGGGGFRVPR